MPIVSPRAKMLFAWGVWAALLVADLVWTAVCGNEVPFWDDWEFVPQITGGRPVTYAWLWSPHAEHRIVLPRLVYLGAVRIAGGDLRAPLIANVLLIAAAAAVLLLAIRRMRGHTAATDALVPIVFMHPGHAQVFLWGMGLAVSIWAMLGAVALALVARGPRCSWRRAIVLALSLAGLALSGASGLALVPPFVLWLAWAMKDATRLVKVAIAIPGTLAVLAWLASLLWLDRPAVHPPSPGILPALGTALEFLAMSFGPTGRATWPVSGMVMLVAVAVTVVLLGHALATQPSERIRTAGLLTALGAFVGLAIIVGWGRAGFGPGIGLATRYGLLAALAIVCAYVAALQSARWAPVVQTTLFVLVCAGLPYDVAVGIEDGAVWRARGMAVRADVDAGLSPHEIATRHVGVIYPEPTALEQGLALLRMARLGPYRTATIPGRRYPMFATTPDLVRSSLAVEPVTVDGEEGLLVHAPGEMRIHIAPGTQALALRFGLRPEAYLRGGRTDGVAFSADLVIEGGEVPLFFRMLDPFHTPSDRGLQSTRLEITTPRGGDIVLRTMPGPANELSWDWSVWTAVDVSAGG